MSQRRSISPGRHTSHQAQSGSVVPATASIVSTTANSASVGEGKTPSLTEQRAGGGGATGLQGTVTLPAGVTADEGGGDGTLAPTQKLKASQKKALIAPSKLRVRAAEFTVSTTRIDGHNFAIRLLQSIEAYVEDIKREFARNTDQKGFVTKQCATVIMERWARKGPTNKLEESWLAEYSDIQLRDELAKVFQAVDFGNTGKVTFDDFMGYVIDCSMQGQVGRVEERIPDYATAGAAFLRNLDEVHVAKYCPELRRIITGGKTVGQLDVATMTTTSFPYSCGTAKDRFPTVYDIDYVPHLNAAAVVGTEKTIMFVHIDKGHVLFRITSRYQYLLLTFDRATNTVLCSGRAGHVQCYGIPPHRLSDIKYTEGHKFENHRAMVTKIVSLEREGLVATASLDCTVVIQDIVSGEMLTKFCGHETSVHCLAYVRSLNVMASVGFDTVPHVWMISSVASRADSFKLTDLDTPHVDHVVDITSVGDSPQLISLDSHGIVKIWDLRVFRCAQTYRIEKLTNMYNWDPRKIKWHTMLWDAQAETLCVFSMRRIQKFKKLVPKKETASLLEGTNMVRTAESTDRAPVDEYPLTCMGYNSTNQTIIVAAEQRIKIFDAFTGKLEVLLEKLTSGASSITAICVSDNGKLFYMGLKGGRVTSHQYSTGTLVTTFMEEGGSEVVDLAFLEGSEAFAVLTWDACRIYPAFATGKHILYFFPDPTRSSDVKSIFFDPLYCILSIGERTGSVPLWEGRRRRFSSDTVRCLGIPDMGRVEATVVHFLSGFPAIAVADNFGRVGLFTTSPHPVPNRRFAEINLKEREIVKMAWYAGKRVLYIADEAGVIAALDVTPALRRVNIKTISGNWEELMGSIGRSGTAPQGVEYLVPFAERQAHFDTITGLIVIPGSGILVSCSTDRRCLAWSLGLHALGEMDPHSIQGTYQAPFSTTHVEPIKGLPVFLRSFPQDDLTLLPLGDSDAMGNPNELEAFSRREKVRQGKRFFVPKFRPTKAEVRGDLVIPVDDLENEGAKDADDDGDDEQDRSKPKVAPRLIKLRTSKSMKEEIERHSCELQTLLHGGQKESISSIKAKQMLSSGPYGAQSRSMRKARSTLKGDDAEVEYDSTLPLSQQRQQSRRSSASSSGSPGRPGSSTAGSERGRKRSAQRLRHHANKPEQQQQEQQQQQQQQQQQAARRMEEEDQAAPSSTSPPWALKAKKFKHSDDAIEALHDLYSCNSTGVDCHTTVMYAPDPMHYRVKRHVVDCHEGEDSGTGFNVTMDYPVEPDAKVERDYHIRQLMEKDEVEHKRAAELLEAATQDVILTHSPSGARAMGLLQDDGGAGLLPSQHQRALSEQRAHPGMRGSVVRRQRTDKSAGDVTRMLQHLLPKDIIAIRQFMRRRHPLCETPQQLIESLPQIPAASQRKGAAILTPELQQQQQQQELYLSEFGHGHAHSRQHALDDDELEIPSMIKQVDEIDWGTQPNLNNTMGSSFHQAYSTTIRSCSNAAQHPMPRAVRDDTALRDDVYEQHMYYGQQQRGSAVYGGLSSPTRARTSVDFMTFGVRSLQSLFNRTSNSPPELPAVALGAGTPTPTVANQSTDASALVPVGHSIDRRRRNTTGGAEGTMGGTWSRRFNIEHNKFSKTMERRYPHVFE